MHRDENCIFRLCNAISTSILGSSFPPSRSRSHPSLASLSLSSAGLAGLSGWERGGWLLCTASSLGCGSPPTSASGSGGQVMEITGVALTWCRWLPLQIDMATPKNKLKARWHPPLLC
jgi:hypothetical protein